MPSTPTIDVESLSEEASQNLERGSTHSVTLNAYPAPIQKLPNLVERLTRTNKKSSNQLHQSLVAAEAYLSNSLLDLSDLDNRFAAHQLQDWTIGVISSTHAFAKEAPYAAEPKPVIPSEDLARLCSLKATGLRLLSHLQDLQVSSSDSLAALVACLATFTDLHDPWTNEDASSLAPSMLSKHLKSLRDAAPDCLDNLISQLLQNYVKPLFIKSKSSLLTDQGRKAIAPLPGTAVPSDFESGSKPWKFQSPHIVTVFQWILEQLDAAMVEKHWPLIIPPLLTILDDVSIQLKIRGCQLLTILLRVVSASLLERSGLGEVFHDTLMPYLLFLPPLTPEEESIPLLNATYDAVLALTMTRFDTTESKPQKVKTLDAIIRYGIFKGYTHAGEKVKIAELLLMKSADLVNAMGIYCVKHLKDLLPIISTILTAPFATAYPPLLEASVQLLRAIMVNGWPRVAFHRAEVLEGLIICWSRIQEEDRPTTALLTVRKQIEQVLRAVVQLLSGDPEMREDLRLIRACDPRLETILNV
ncbi:MAG: hypothetical protein LQ339_001014 [Xanthoria mediterranea]|nr:MAG: hypothetical protein LQ339_001014 [Xanthoria mediterranea]